MKISKISISNIKTLTEAVIEANETLDGQVWWRGQGNSNWELLPSVFRVKDHGKRYEDNITRRFQQRAPSRCAKPPAPNDYFGWLFLMQHYGLPTRLLDWTESPLFATFFATSQKEEGALYALNPFSLNHNQADRNGILLPDNETNSELIQSAFGYDDKDFNRVVAIAPPEIDIRMMVQLSSFTVHGYGKSLSDLPNNEKFLIKFIIPSDCKERLSEELKYLGVRKANLFPDLEHLADEIKSLVFKDTPYDDATEPTSSTNSKKVPFSSLSST